MNKTFKAALAATLVVGTASMARADLSADGQVGLILNPTAQKPDAGTVRVQGEYARINAQGSGNDVDFFGIVGAGGIGDNFEVSGGVQHIKNGDDDTGFTIGAKYVHMPRVGAAGSRGLNIAAGAGYSKVRTKNLYGYLVGTMAFGAPPASGRAPITGSLGVRFNKFDDVLGDDNQVAVYGGVEVPFTRTGDWSGVAELGSQPVDGGDVQYSLGVRFRPAGQAWSAGAGILRTGFGDDTGFYALIGYNATNLLKGAGK
ncbi:MAG: hypothetical protein M3347_10010 [Armatimonadota bacterium]|nr:hypothetical protein [Armatimonadota bacterium]